MWLTPQVALPPLPLTSRHTFGIPALASFGFIFDRERWEAYFVSASKVFSPRLLFFSPKSDTKRYECQLQEREAVLQTSPQRLRRRTEGFKPACQSWLPHLSSETNFAVGTGCVDSLVSVPMDGNSPAIWFHWTCWVSFWRIAGNFQSFSLHFVADGCISTRITQTTLDAGNPPPYRARTGA